MSETGREYSTKDIGNILDIADSTVRKYCQLLEKSGYQFTRSENGYRLFFERDLRALSEFKNLSKDGIQVDEIAKKIVSASGTGDPQSPKTKVSDDMLLNLMETVQTLQKQNETLLEHSEIQARFNEELVKRLDQQQKYIDNKLSERDKLLTDSLKESMETRKLIAAAKEEKKSGFFARLFNK
ncbi:hypothetical protein [Heyndrickxia acidicola]|uniref:HTH merR-type domain-containing protein n=1 Tax=Heyndrickxia acidicola TaxID=209389 RepID=A0ABU6MRN9_9BACI|nr:hypothetical protein [Heyndrickxia acidicola]MED1205877.1 hypothetical protein [Heyndrickxia acidicola]